MNIALETGLNTDSLFGIPVRTGAYIPENKPKFSLKYGDYVSEECRADFNQFLIENFGYVPCAFITKDAIYIHPNNVRHLEKLMAKVAA